VHRVISLVDLSSMNINIAHAVARHPALH
jgi:hypothetical protein